MSRKAWHGEPVQPSLPPQNDRIALAYATLGIFLLTVMDAIVKALSTDYSAFQSMLFRHGVGIAVTGLLFAIVRPGWPTREQAKGHVLRALLMLATGLMFFHALGKMPLAELFVYTFTTPFFVALFGALLLKETLTRGVILGILLGFSGLLCIVLTDPAARFGSGSSDARLFALLMPITYALAMVLLRKQAASEPVTRVIFMQSIVVCVLLVPTVLPSLPMPKAEHWPMILGVGIIGSLGNLALTMGFARAPASRVIVTEYTGLIWAALIGYAVFSEVPRAMVWMGAVLVMAGCYAVVREKRS